MTKRRTIPRDVDGLSASADLVSAELVYDSIAELLRLGNGSRQGGLPLADLIRLASASGSNYIGTSITDADSIGITAQDWLRDQVVLPRQFGLVGDGITVENNANVLAFFNAIKRGKKGYIPAGCWLRFSSQQIINFGDLQHFYIEGAGADLCGFRFSGFAAPFLRFNYANLYNAVHFRNLTMAVDSALDASGCISLYGVGFAAPGNSAQNDFTDVVWRGWDGRVQDDYWGNCLYAELVSNIMIRGGGSWGPNDVNGKGDPFIISGKGSDANPYAVQFDFDAVYLTQFNKGITFGTYAQGLTLKAVNMNRGNYGVYIGAGQVANDIISISGGSQFNCNIAGIGCFEDEATISVTDTTFVIEKVSAVGIRTASRWGRYKGNHFQGIGSPANSAGMDLLSGADQNLIDGNIASYLPTGYYFRSGSANNKLSASNIFDNVTTKYLDSGTANQLGNLTL